MKNSLCILLFFFIPYLVLSQQNPTITCLDVDENGDVTVHWLPFMDVNFENYKIFYSSNNTIFSEVYSTGDINTNIFVHQGANADISNRFYKLQVNYGGDSIQTGVFQTIFLFLDATQAGKAILSWNAPNSASGNKYTIWRKLPSDNWKIIADDISGTFYNNIIENGICETFIDYKIEFSDAYSCSYNSNTQGAIFTEDIQPAKTILDSVSINYIDGVPRIVMGWEASVSEDVVGYILYRWESGFQGFDTVYGINSTFYIDTLVPACDTTYQYAIAAIDSCGNKDPGSFQNPLQNIQLYDVVYDPCMLEATITFEPFIDLEGDSITFELIGNSSAGFYQAKIDRTLYAQNYNRTVNEVITVIDEDLRVGRIYDYYIREKIYKGDKFYTTSSCMQSIYAYGYEKPTYSYFVNANVLPDNQIELTIDYDTAVTHSYLQLWRNEPGDEELNYLMTIQVDTLTNNPFAMLDTSADGSLGYYLYGIKIMDSCNKKVLESNRLKTMALSVVIKDRDHNWLRWNRFEGWKAGVEKYYIYRKDGNLEPTSPIDSVYWYENEYIDDISNLNNAAENLVYWVQAIERGGNSFGFKETSNSNRAVVIPESDIYFPNAFKPGGTEEVFKPIFRFLGGSNYFFQVYNRWGQLVYETTDPYDGWDGTYKGTIVVQGTYIYKFQYLDVYGNSFNKQGTVTVIY